jgi:hypothetical protein
MSHIIFEDGLEYHKIVNDLDNQGKYKWLLDANTKNLVVGLNNDNLVIKSGRWISGVFNT